MELFIKNSIIAFILSNISINSLINTPPTLYITGFHQDI